MENRKTTEKFKNVIYEYNNLLKEEMNDLVKISRYC